jgi:hypothetical protein
MEAAFKDVRLHQEWKIHLKTAREGLMSFKFSDITLIVNLFTFSYLFLSQAFRQVFLHILYVRCGFQYCGSNPELI